MEMRIRTVVYYPAGKIRITFSTVLAGEADKPFASENIAQSELVRSAGSQRQHGRSTKGLRLKRRPAPEFVIFGYSHTNDSGGGLVLHELCDRLNRLGYRAAFWPFWTPVLADLGWKSLRQWLGYWLKFRFARFSRGPFTFPLARRRDLKSAIVVYPEVVAGNPLSAKSVVRWLLYNPGHHTGTIEYGKDDLFFSYNEAFNDERLNKHNENVLRVSVNIPAYKQINFGPRSGACVLIRKGNARVHDQHPQDAILVDDLDHESIARLLNEKEFLYSYDLHSYYCTYAAICGCVPIVIPQANLTEQQWNPELRDRIGIAYGVERIDWAKSTRTVLLDELDKARGEEDICVQSFVVKCREHFDR